MKRFWAWPWQLRRAGVMGINARNLLRVNPLNPPRGKIAVNNKAVTKEILRRADIPVPQTYGLLSDFADLRRLPEILASRTEFVIKPCRGAGGRGVLVIAARRDDAFETVGGDRLSLGDLRFAASAILDGSHSMGGRPDEVLVEARVADHPFFSDLAGGGTADIRVIVQDGRPLAAMLRLPTRRSAGRANLHQGGLGAGIDLARGAITGATWRNRPVETHPDTGRPIVGLAIPHWDEIVSLAKRAGEALGMGYLGVDIVLDGRLGPMALEANAHPGLSIQLATGQGLRTET